MTNKQEFWLAVMLLFIAMGIYANHQHIEELACFQGVERLCSAHLW